MKKLLIIALLAWVCAATSMAVSPKHRHHPKKEIVEPPANGVNNQGAEAYSDTSMVDEPVDDVAAEDTVDTAKTYPVDYANDSTDRFMRDVSHMFGLHSLFGAVLLLIFVAFIFLAPFIIIIMVIRYLIKRHNDNVTLAMKAMEKGYPLSSMPKAARYGRSYDNRKWENAVKQIFLGIGLIIFFCFWGIEVAVGIGFLVLFMGLGQLVIARHTHRNREQDEPRFGNDFVQRTTEKQTTEVEKYDDFDPQI